MKYNHRDTETQSCIGSTPACSAGRLARPDRMDPRTDENPSGSRIHPSPVARGAWRRVEPMIGWRRGLRVNLRAKSPCLCVSVANSSLSCRLRPEVSFLCLSFVSFVVNVAT